MNEILAGEIQDAVNFTNCAHRASHIPEDANRVRTILFCVSVPALAPFPSDCLALSDPGAPSTSREEIIVLGIANDKLLLPSPLAALFEKTWKVCSSLDLMTILPGSFWSTLPRSILLGNLYGKMETFLWRITPTHADLAGMSLWGQYRPSYYLPCVHPIIVLMHDTLIQGQFLTRPDFPIAWCRVLALHDIVMPVDKKVTSVMFPKAPFVEKVAYWICKALQLSWRPGGFPVLKAMGRDAANICTFV